MHNLLVLPGDGIGPEVTEQAVRVLRRVGEVFQQDFVFREALIGGAALDAQGVPLPEDTLQLARESDAVLFGAIGGPRWNSLPAGRSPEQGLLALRQGMGVFANLRPARLYPELRGASALKTEILEKGVDLIIVRELTGGLYFGQPRGRTKLPDGQERALDTMVYSSGEIQRVARVAFRLAQNRRQRLLSVDKANVLESSRLWREVVTEVARDFPQVHLSHMYVDNCAMQLVRNPGDFDVILTENTFGDILSDLTASLVGSMGLLPSASLGEGSRGLYEPIHGSAPDLAGQNRANPLAAILSAAMLLESSLGLRTAAQAVERAVRKTIGDGYRTQDILTPGMIPVSTEEMGAAVAARITR